MNMKARWLARAHAFLIALTISLLSPLSAHAQQQAKVFRIGQLCNSDASSSIAALRDLGYVEGRNAVYEVRVTQGQPERAREQAADLVRAKVDVIVAHTNVNAFAAKQATSTIPIVVWGRMARLPPASFRAWRALAATSPDSRPWRPSWIPSAWNC